MSDEDILPFQILSNNGNSAQVLADRATDSHRSLRTHFRCQPGIIDICDRLCGYGLVHTPTLSQAAAPHILPHPVVVIDTVVSKNDCEEVGINGAERTRVIEVLLALGHAGISWDEIAVITPMSDNCTIGRSAP